MLNIIWNSLRRVIGIFCISFWSDSLNNWPYETSQIIMHHEWHRSYSTLVSSPPQDRVARQPAVLALTFLFVALLLVTCCKWWLNLAHLRVLTQWLQNFVFTNSLSSLTQRWAKASKIMEPKRQLKPKEHPTVFILMKVMHCKVMNIWLNTLWEKTEGKLIDRNFVTTQDKKKD